MPNNNHNKIYTVLVLCVGIIISVWLFQKKPVVVAEQSDIVQPVVKSFNTIETKNDDWKNLLAKVDSSKQTTKTSVASNPDIFDGTSLTAQMARDLFSRYLISAKNGKDLTDEEVAKITDDLLRSPEYTKFSGAVYIISNLHLVAESNKESLGQYADTVNNILKKRIANIKVKEGVFSIINTAIITEDAKKIAELDSYITESKGTVTDLLNMQVPRDLASYHLAILNAASNVSADIEAMRQTLDDPVKGFIGANQYPINVEKFTKAIASLNDYYRKRVLGSI